MTQHRSVVVTNCILTPAPAFQLLPKQSVPTHAQLEERGWAETKFGYVDNAICFLASSRMMWAESFSHSSNYFTKAISVAYFLQAEMSVLFSQCMEYLNIATISSANANTNQALEATIR